MTPEISAKINNYYHSSGYSPTAGELSELVREGIITQAEYEEVMHGSVYYTDNTAEKGDVISVSEPSQSVEISPKKAKHPVFSRLLLDKNSDIDMNQFSLTSLKEKWTGDKYTFKTEKNADGNEIITVVNIATGKPVEQVIRVDGDDGYVEFSLKEFDFGGNEKSELAVAKGKILSNKEINPDGSYVLKEYDDGDTSDLVSKTIVGSDLSKTEYTYNNKELTGIYKYDSDGNFISGNLYSGGKMYADCDEEGNIEKNYLTEELIKGLSDAYANPVALKQNISSRINGENVDVILDDYYEETGHFIADDILASESLSEADKKDLLTSLYKTMDKSLEKEDEFANNLKNEILFAYFDKKDDDFKNKILSITTDNVQDIASAFGVYSCDDDFMGKRITQSLPEMIEKSNMSEKDKKECLDHIVSLLEIIINKNGIYTEDVISDINSHKDNVRMFEIDYRRLMSRADVRANEGQVSTPNGMVDLDFVQGGIGSCWLLAALKAINVKQGGNQVLNDLLKVDNDKREVVVELPGMGKSYTISFDEINSQTYLATGDGDVRAIEIAFDRFLRDEAYEGVTTIYGDGYFNDFMDIEGGDPKNVLNAILHLSERQTYDNLAELDFNVAKDVHVLSFSDEASLVAIESDSDGEDAEFLDSNHAYAVAGSDADYIYLIDPREKGNKQIKVKRSSFDGVEVLVDSARLIG